MPVTDARTLPDASQLQGDIVIIGGGMAGLAIAHEFIGSDARVIVLEGGGSETNAAIQLGYTGRAAMRGPGNVDLTIDNYLVTSRIRALGGSGNVWGGKCGPLDAADFADRPWRKHSGWPFGRRDLKPFYDRACDRLKLPHFPIDDGPPDTPTAPAIGAANGALRSTPRVHSPVSGGADHAAFAEFRDAPGRAANIQLYTHANVTGIRLAANGIVDRLEVKCLSGTSHVVRARHYILATGGIENARLLLASNADRPEGVGNRSGWVGRCFMGHVTIAASGRDGKGTTEILMTSPSDLALYNNYQRERPHAVFALDLATQRRLRTGNCTITLATLPTTGLPRAGAGTAIEQLVGAAQAIAPRRMGYYVMSEEAPNPDSRITLDAQPDGLGQPRARLDWIWSQGDWQSLALSVRGLAAAFGQQGLGRLCWPVASENLLKAMSPSRHHMGTTRMADDPAQGVVDRDCRVHGVANLYVAGSSVFPTSGLVNPTLTLTALAIRLADHLKARARA